MIFTAESCSQSLDEKKPCHVPRTRQRSAEFQSSAESQSTFELYLLHPSYRGLDRTLRKKHGPTWSEIIAYCTPVHQQAHDDAEQQSKVNNASPTYTYGIRQLSASRVPPTLIRSIVNSALEVGIALAHELGYPSTAQFALYCLIPA